MSFLKGLFAAVGAASAIWVTRLLTPSAGAPVAVLVAALGAVIVARVLELIFIDTPIRFSVIRRRFEPLAPFEGHWLLINAFTDQPNSFGTLVYDARHKIYRFEGVGFMRDGRVVLDWRATALVFDPKMNELRYLYTTREHGLDATVFSGYGVLTFFSDGHGSSVSGTDSWVEDRHDGLRRITAPMRRVSTLDLRDLLGVDRVDTDADRRKLVEATSSHFSKTNNARALKLPEAARD
jgi:hypothetical protein